MWIGLANLPAAKVDTKKSPKNEMSFGREFVGVLVGV